MKAELCDWSSKSFCAEIVGKERKDKYENLTTELRKNTII
jgi:hypothetical protein